MIVINFTSKKLFAYRYNGILELRCNFRELTDKYGQAQAVSADGLNFLFVKGKNEKTYLTVLRINLKDYPLTGFEILTNF